MLRNLIYERLRSIQSEMGFDYEFNIEIPDERFGDYSSNIALIGSKYFKKPPIEVANFFLEKLNDDPLFSEINVAGPGFINFRISKTFYIDILNDMLTKGEEYWKAKKNGKKVQFEYGSANPTGPFTVGHGRQLIIGDVLSNVFEFLGHDVTREMYLNDAGRQIKLLGKSLWVRYNELYGKHFEIPEDGYKGTYLIDIAKKLSVEIGDKYVGKWDEQIEKIFMKYAVDNILDSMYGTLSKLDNHFDSVVRESSIIEKGLVNEILTKFESKGLIYEKDGAIWFKVSALIDEEDKVLVRSDGTYTYFLTDIAYHYDKFLRKYDKVYDIFGSDHHGHIPRMKASMKALEIPDKFLDFIVHQFVTLKRKNKVIKMSTRFGQFVTLDELIDEVGKDATRYFFVMNDINTHLNFDLDLAKSNTVDNPVFYVQYAYARINNIFEKAKEKGIRFSVRENIEELVKDNEMTLIKLLDELSFTLEDITEKLSPHILTNYIYNLSEKFHSFYAKEKILDINNLSLTNARLNLLSAMKIVYEIVFKLLGISAPKYM
ncbi:arginine--tRNA ligase [Thermosipho atlanticus]|uniref:Arginine--tRNA ligase n=1 Tax=Thermosipho atlanticus DSM 15807 TaxID=1123380 RepID=A0A1M5R1H1_9BACT|nr:arginine--tRNA ligase [Thermosipho atlanticus]SHH20225.1 arginyl-tRNA synthetase [Thermosipho atlanticus DSM 15807]